MSSCLFYILQFHSCLCAISTPYSATPMSPCHLNILQCHSYVFVPTQCLTVPLLCHCSLRYLTEPLLYLRATSISYSATPMFLCKFDTLQCHSHVFVSLPHHIVLLLCQYHFDTPQYPSCVSVPLQYLTVPLLCFVPLRYRTVPGVCLRATSISYGASIKSSCLFDVLQCYLYVFVTLWYSTAPLLCLRATSICYSATPIYS
jgi:hypothetical protein